MAKPNQEPEGTEPVDKVEMSQVPGAKIKIEQGELITYPTRMIQFLGLRMLRNTQIYLHVYLEKHSENNFP